jgi:hypothetical protein
MSDQVKEILDIPRDFFRDGAFFLNRCTKPSKRGDLLFYQGSLTGRVFGDFEGGCGGIFGDGVYWICSQVGAYSYQ